MNERLIPIRNSIKSTG